MKKIVPDSLFAGLAKQEVLQRLAQELPDVVIEALFAEREPAEIRRVLWPEWQAEVEEEAVPEPVLVEKVSLSKNMRLFTDGASRGNPGLAGAGYTIDDGQGQELLGEGVFLGSCTNNVAEYEALIRGLQAAQQLAPERLEIFLDSQLIVRQVEGRYKVKNATLKPLFTRVKQLLAGLSSWTINHVPREENKRADELANEGIDLR